MQKARKTYGTKFCWSCSLEHFNAKFRLPSKRQANGSEALTQSIRRISRSLTFRGLAHDPQRVLATVQRLAFMRVKLGLQAGGRIFEAANVGRFELLTAMGANGNTRRCADVLHDPNSPFRHDSVSHSPCLSVTLWKSNGTITDRQLDLTLHWLDERLQLPARRNRFGMLVHRNPLRNPAADPQHPRV
jgi:hypothetical protein